MMINNPAQLEIGAEIEPLVKAPVTREMFKAYNPASGDDNPIHVDEDFARSAGYPTVFAQGMLIMGFVGQLLAERFGPNNIRRFKARFAAITWPGDQITCRGKVTGKKQSNRGTILELDLTAEDQKGEVKVVGAASVLAR